MPRRIATTLTTSVGSGMRRLAGHDAGLVETSRQPPQASEIRRNSASIQRRAAPMPRVSDTVSDSVWRVPKPASVRMSASMRSADTASISSWTRGSGAGGGGVSGASWKPLGDGADFLLGVEGRGLAEECDGEEVVRQDEGEDERWGRSVGVGSHGGDLMRRSPQPSNERQTGVTPERRTSHLAASPATSTVSATPTETAQSKAGESAVASKAVWSGGQ